MPQTFSSAMDRPRAPPRPRDADPPRPSCPRDMRGFYFGFFVFEIQDRFRGSQAENVGPWRSTIVHDMDVYFVSVPSQRSIFGLFGETAGGGDVYAGRVK